MTLARWYHWRSPSQEVRQAVAEQMQHIVHQVNNGLAEWGWRPTSWGRWACTADHTFSIFSNKNERAKAKHQLRQSWRKTLLLRWLQTDRRDADIGRHINLQDQIDDSFVDQLRKIFKRCTDSHVQAVMMGGMRTAASTRWAGNLKKLRKPVTWCALIAIRKITLPLTIFFGSALLFLVSGDCRLRRVLLCGVWGGGLVLLLRNRSSF